MLTANYGPAVEQPVLGGLRHGSLVHGLTELVLLLMN